MPNPTDLIATEAAVAVPRVAVDLVAKSNVTLSGEQTIDGVTSSASTVLCIGQTDASENGIYVTSSGSWSRASSLRNNSDLADWIAIGIEAYVGPSGDYYGQSRKFRLRIANAPTTLDTDDIEWEVVPGRYKLYAAIMPNSTTTQIDVINIPAIAGANIDVQVVGAGTATGPTDVARIYVGDSSAIDTTATNYYSRSYYHYGTSGAGAQIDNDAPYVVLVGASGGTDDQLKGGHHRSTIMNYSLPGFYTGFYYSQQAHHDAAQSDPIWQAFSYVSGVWENTAVVERVRVLMGESAGTTGFFIGTRVAITLEVNP